RARGAAVPDRRAAESVLVPAAGAGAVVRLDAAAAADRDARHVRDRLRDDFGVRPLPLTLGQRGGFGPAADVHGRGLAVAAAFLLHYRSLRLANQRGSAPTERRARRHRARARARATSLSARWPCGRRGARAC